MPSRMRDYLRQLPGVYDVRQDLDVGKLEYQYSLNERGRELGLNQQQLADAVRTGFLGLEAVQVSWGDERIPVRVIYERSGTTQQFPGNAVHHAG